MRRTSGLALILALVAPRPGAPGDVPDVRLFFEAAGLDDKQAREALDRIAKGWRDDYAPLIVDLARLLPRPRGPGSAEEGPETDPAGEDTREGGLGPSFGRADFPAAGAAARPSPGARVRERLVRFLEKQTGQRFGHDLRRWRQWIWRLPAEPHPHYAFFKSALYSRIDPRMASFFSPGVRSLIRLDEVDWGGVAVNGIPPLDHPAVVPAREAAYLQDRNVVFGVAVGGEARAYPKRILAWHELARDRVGGVELTIVYCTLCGTVVPYGSEAGGRKLTFGTSGLLYRSNKLMFDEETMSLWSSSEGRPVIGELAGSGLELKAYPVVTTTWGEWVSAHPETTVLSLATGHRRDYSEGAAYRDYFSTDELMFDVPKTDSRLKNKAEVLTLLLRPQGDEGASRRALALAADFLRKHPLHALSFAGRDLVVVTSPGGANRVYDAGPTRFVRQLEAGRLQDGERRAWRVTEDALVCECPGMSPRARVPARRAFWFGWYAQFPDTELVR